MRERERGREIFSDAPMSDRVWLMRLRWERVCEGGREGGRDGKHTHVSGLFWDCLRAVSGLSRGVLGQTDKTRSRQTPAAHRGAPNGRQMCDACTCICNEVHFRPKRH